MAVAAVGVLADRGRGGGMALLETGEDGALAAAKAGAPEVVVACLNAPKVTIVSGPDGPLEAVVDAARAAGVRGARLAVPYLSHHPAMVAPTTSGTP